jgi:hypothetical protein
MARLGDSEKDEQFEFLISPDELARIKVGTVRTAEQFMSLISPDELARMNLGTVRAATSGSPGRARTCIYAPKGLTSD